MDNFKYERMRKMRYIRVLTHQNFHQDFLLLNHHNVVPFFILLNIILNLISFLFYGGSILNTTLNSLNLPSKYSQLSFSKIYLLPVKINVMSYIREVSKTEN